MEAKPIPARLIRAAIEASAFRAPPPTPRQLARRNRIRGAAALVMAQFGRECVTFNVLGLALGISPASIRLDFVDMDSLLFEILRCHLANVTRAIEALGPRASEKSKRAAFAGFTGLDEHTLLVEERRALPEDLLARIEEAVATLADLVAGPPAQEHRPTTPKKPCMHTYARIVAAGPEVVQPSTIAAMRKQQEWGERAAPPTPPGVIPDPSG